MVWKLHLMEVSIWPLEVSGYTVELRIPYVDSKNIYPYNMLIVFFSNIHRPPNHHSHNFTEFFDMP